MENLNLLGMQVNSMSEAVQLLGCTEQNLIFKTTEVFLNGLTVFFYSYATEGVKEYYYSFTVINQLSNQFN